MKTTTLSVATGFTLVVNLATSAVPANGQSSTFQTLSLNMPSALAPAPVRSGEWKLFGSERMRVEDYNFFPTDKANGAYTFVGSDLRLGVRRVTSRDEVVFELFAPGLFNLPTRATATAPQGQLGQGSSYRVQNGGQVASVFPKQAYIRFKNVGDMKASIKLGRFEFSDGAEPTTSDPTVTWIKANRVGQRLIGPFGYTHVGRAFDGLQAETQSPGVNTTFVAAFPTRGAFDLQGSDTLTRVPITYLANTRTKTSKSGTLETRLFAIYYQDTRGGVLKVDNRPAAARTADTAQIDLLTYGGDLIGTKTVGANTFDTLVWIAGQSGKWGSLRQSASSFDIETGWKPNRLPWKPWIRAAYYYASGSGSNASGQHATFDPLLPTARIYARYPFYTEMNIQDLFASVQLNPVRRLSIRSEVHGLKLADRNDLWYSGGGAFDNSNFGYSGRPSGGHSNLGTMYDTALDYTVSKSVLASLYFAYVQGGDVEKGIFKSGDSVFFFSELTYKF